MADYSETGGKCWYNPNRKCTQPRDCKIAGHCLDCWNPALVEAMRAGPLWVWADQ
jgi:hypothetical protein